MKKIFLFIVLALISACYVFSQEQVEILKKEFRTDKDGFRAAWKKIKVGNLNYNDGRNFYGLALEDYLQAFEYNGNNAELNYKIGVCYLFTTEKNKSIPFFEKAYQIKNGVASNIHYLLGKAYHLDYKFDSAIVEYKKHLSISQDIDENLSKKINKNINDCTNAKEIILIPTRIRIENIGSTINSKYPDYYPLISIDGEMLIFTSRRNNTTGGELDINNGKYYEDVYMSVKDGDKWQKPVNLNRPINTDGHDAAVGLSPDGQKLITYRGINGGDIYYCEQDGEKWTTPIAFPETVNTEFHENTASFSPDGNQLYFTSNRENDNLGYHDIFVSERQSGNKWSVAKNISQIINSQYDELTVFLHPDGRTLYFSSNGHKTIGGYDIFKTVRDENGNWSEPANLGFPVNTPDDDIFISISANGKYAYIASTASDGYGDKDIYRITFLTPVPEPVLSSEDPLIATIGNTLAEETTVDNMFGASMTLLKGRVVDGDFETPLSATIEIADNVKNTIISRVTTNTKTGKFLISLPSGTNYGIAVEADGYLFHSENFNIQEGSIYQEIENEISLYKIKKGSKIVLKNIFFDLDKSNIRPESDLELKRLLKLLNKYPKLRIEISGHTDNQGSLAYNEKLSLSRAKEVTDYLIEVGIPSDRMIYKGYAFKIPIATNDTPEGRQLNRRVEFKIISI